MNPIGRQGIRCISIVLLVVGSVLVPPPSHGQLVSDGRTNILDGVSTNLSGDIIVGNIDRFTLLVITNGATVSNTNGNLIIGQNSVASSNAVVVVGAGSTWINGGTRVGYFGSGNRLSILHGGAVSNAGVCTIGSSSQSNLVIVSDAGSLFRNSSIVLGHGGNQLVVSNGAVVSANSTYAQGSNSAIILTGAGSWLTNQYDFQLGASGFSNALTITDGAALADGIGQIGNGLGNRVVVDGPQSFWMNYGDLSISSPCNLIIITNGARSFASSAYLSGSSNTVVVAGSGSFWTNRFDLYVGYGGSNCRLFITNGGSVVSSHGYVSGFFSSVSNQVIVADPGSVWKTLSSLTIGGASGNGANELIISNSGTVLAPTLTVNGGPLGFNVLISGGNLVVTNTIRLFGAGPSFFTLDSGLVTAENLSSSQTTLDFRAGTLRLHSSQVDGTSPFRIGNGAAEATLELINYSSHNFLSRSLVVSSNATLKGVGTIWANVTVSNGGTLSPSPSWGSSVGSMIVCGNLLLSPGSTNIMGLNGTGNYAKFDYFVGISNVTYGGTLLLTNIAGQLAPGNSFRLFSASNYSGAYSAIIPPSPGPGLKWNTNELNVDGVLRVVAVHPLPPTIAGLQSSRTNIQIRVSGGVPYDPCYLLTTTNIQSAAGWEFCDTNRFDSGGVSIFNRPISPIEKERYFRAQVE